MQEASLICEKKICIMTEQEHISLGDELWKRQDWKGCLDNYSEALRLNPNSIAAEKTEMVMNIINFFNKDTLNP